MAEYSIYSEFDLSEHKKHYTDYLEVVIEENGHILYAVPSHQEVLIKLACQNRKCTRQQLEARVPQEYWFDFLSWLCAESKAVAVWINFIKYKSITPEQEYALTELKAAGQYSGDLPASNI